MNTHLLKSLTAFVGIVLIGLTMTLSSCSKNDIDINIKNDNGSGTGTNGSGTNSDGSATDTVINGQTKYLVTFHAMVESITRSSSPIPEDELVTMYTYNKGNLENSGSYSSNSSGSLTPSGSQLYLSNGTYTFYGASCNSTTKSAPTFSNGVASNLSNGIDYIESKNTGISVAQSSVTVPLIFYHKCAQVVVEVVAATPTSSSDTVTIKSLNSATITPSTTTGATWNLINDVITSASTVSSTPMNMGVNGFKAALIMLPLSSSYTGSLSMSFNITLGSSASARNYSVQVPMPSGSTGLQAGKSYLYKIVISAQGISFSSVQVENWEEVDETGTPLYPGQS